MQIVVNRDSFNIIDTLDSVSIHEVSFQKLTQQRRADKELRRTNHKWPSMVGTRATFAHVYPLKLVDLILDLKF